MPYCRNCGTKLEENARFCHKCGTPAATLPPPSPPATMKPNRNDPLFVTSIVIAAVVISAIIIGAIILLAFFHVNFGTNNSNQPNLNTLNLIFSTIVHKQMPLLTS
ncbi:MAG: zinc ribbon domain-containing protein [Candidatus Bathyarchaeia archaeon]